MPSSTFFAKAEAVHDEYLQSGRAVGRTNPLRDAFFNSGRFFSSTSATRVHIFFHGKRILRAQGGKKKLARLKKAGALCPDCSPFLDQPNNSQRKLCVAACFVTSRQKRSVSFPLSHGDGLLSKAFFIRPSWTNLQAPIRPRAKQSIPPM